MALQDSGMAASGKQSLNTRRTVVLLGPPGAGKGTQAIEIARHIGIPHFSTGHMLRDHLAGDSNLGQRARPCIEAGELVPDELVNAMVAERLVQPDCANGCVLDGYPRTVAQAHALDQMLGGAEQGPVVIYLRVEYSKLIERLTGRRSCPQCGTIYNVYLQPPARNGICDRDGAVLVERPDDQEHVIRERLAAYETLTWPLIEFYRGRDSFFEVDAGREPAAVSAALFRILEHVGCPAAP